MKPNDAWALIVYLSDFDENMIFKIIMEDSKYLFESFEITNNVKKLEKYGQMIKFKPD